MSLRKARRSSNYMSLQFNHKNQFIWNKEEEIEEKGGAKLEEK
jgi:hypothetical protein